MTGFRDAVREVNYPVMLSLQVTARNAGLFDLNDVNLSQNEQKMQFTHNFTDTL